MSAEDDVVDHGPACVACGRPYSPMVARLTHLVRVIPDGNLEAGLVQYGRNRDAASDPAMRSWWATWHTLAQAEFDRRFEVLHRLEAGLDES